MAHCHRSKVVSSSHNQDPENSHKPISLTFAISSKQNHHFLLHFPLLFFSPFSYSNQPLTITPKPTSLIYPKVSTLTPVISSLIRFLPLNPCMCCVAFYIYCVLTFQLHFSSTIILPGEKLSFLTPNPKLICVSVFPIVAAQARGFGSTRYGYGSA